MTITLTEAAHNHIEQICEKNPNQLVCLSLKGGGCAGFEYKWSMIDHDQTNKNDKIIGALVITEHALPFLDDVEIDFVSEMLGTKLVINNPNVKSACGCGESIGF